MPESALKDVKQLKIKFDSTCKAGHTLFIKEHKVRKSENSFSHPTIIVMNVPPYCHQRCLRRLFGTCGNIVDIHEQKNPGKIENRNTASKYFGPPKVFGFHVAYISFELRNGIERVMSLIANSTEPICLSTPKHEIATGLKKMCVEYVASFPEFSEVQKEIDSYMEEYDSKIAKQELGEKLQEGKPDQDGWVKVNRKGKNPAFTRSEAVETSIRAKLKRKEENQKSNSMNVYSFQARDSKRAKIIELQKKFEEDKKKLEVIKQTRKFKPF